MGDVHPSGLPAAVSSELVIHLKPEKGQGVKGRMVAMTLPRIKASGTGPKYLESRDATRLSPTIQQCPFGTYETQSS